MSPQLAKARDHKVFPALRRGAALVVTPQGDAAGYGHADLKVERERIMTLLASAEVPNLILDVGDTNYFGSEMIGIFSRMIGVVRDRGGEHAVVNLSDDMREGIAIMKLEQVWNVRDARPAYRELAHESPFAPVQRNLKAIVLVLLAVALVAGAAYAISLIPRGQARREYHVLHDVWEEYRHNRLKLRDLGAKSWADDALGRIEASAERLDKSASNKRPELQHLLNAARDYLPVIIDPHIGLPPKSVVRNFLKEMRSAEEYLEARYEGLDLPTVKELNAPLDPEPSDDDSDPDSGHAAHDPNPVPVPDPDDPDPGTNDDGADADTDADADGD